MQTTCFINDDWDTELVIEFDAVHERPSYDSPGYDDLDIWDIRAADTGAEFVITDQDTLDRIEQACWDQFTLEARRYAH